MRARLVRVFGAELSWRLAVLHAWQLALAVFWLTGVGHGA